MSDEIIPQQHLALADLADALDEAEGYLPQTGENHRTEDARSIIAGVVKDLRAMAAGA